LPIGSEDAFEGLIDLIELAAADFTDDERGMIVPTERPIPAALQEEAEYLHQQAVEMACEFDDDLMSKVLEGEEYSPDEVRQALRKGTLECVVTPVFCGASFKNKGIQQLLDAIVDYLPSPLDIPAIKGIDAKTGNEVERHPDINAPFSALAFKVMTDPYVGKLTYLRVYSGQLAAGSYVLNATKGKNERIGRLLEMHAASRMDVELVSAGDICAAVGLKDTTTGDTLSDQSQAVLLESMSFPDPVIDIAIEPKTKAEQDKLAIALQKLAEEDPTFKVSTNQETGQTVIAGMGELHLEIIVDRLLREFNVEANIGKPQVAYRETAGQAVMNVEGRFIRQTGGRGQYGVCIINLFPQERGTGYVFENKIIGGSIPKEYITPIDKGIQEALATGVLASYPVVDVRIELIDGSYHEVDSSEAAFKIAGSLAIKEALRQSDPKLLEPMMSVEVDTPEDYLGEVMGNLSSRRGQITGIEDRAGVKLICASVPLSEMFGYATDLRSATQGRAVYSMQFEAYEPVPRNVAEEIIFKAGGNA
ncbi:MAG: elongation factor G, partial [Coriobacteriia bacterium]|nr:elongation factor G [Coriobacteriia bacterium]